MNILYAFLVVSVLGLLLGAGLAVADKLLKVKKDEKLEKLEKVNDLPKVDNTGSESEFANLLNKSMAQEEPPAQEPEPDPDTYSIELTPDQLEAYLQSRSVDAIPDEPVKSLVDDEPEEYRPTDRAVRDDHPQEQAANLMRHMIRR